uniref:Uncharacterized protein n=1 Tax=viral metagenome TaxID=1070528 RepID=A0A6H2A561_9ZZZZ
MIQVSNEMLATMVTVLLAVIGLAAWVGALAQKVRGQDKSIEDNRKIAERERERIHIENREDHRQIFDQLDKINTFIRNGK